MMIFLSILITTSLFAQNTIDSLTTIIKNEPNNVQALTQLGVYYHDLGVAGDHRAVKQGEEIFKKALSLDSTNAFAMGYYGSILSLKARDAKMPWTRIKYAKRGFEQLDKSVQINPDDLNIRLIRAMNSYQVPKIMKRLNLAMEDFNFIINHKSFETWSADYKAFVFLHFGKALEKDDQHGKAREFYETAIKEAPESMSADEAKKALKK